MFTDALIIDELLDFFAAAVMTTQYAAQTFISHCAQSPASLKKIREEFIAVASKHPDAESGDKSKREVIDKVVNLETTHDLEYLSWVIMETMRIQAPAPNSSFRHLTQDAKIGGISVRKGDIFMLDFYALHFDAA